MHMRLFRAATKAAAIARGARGLQRASCSHHRCFAATVMSNPAPFVLCADFDETITQRDTIALLFELAANANIRARVQQQQQQLVGQYTSELNAFLARSDIVWKDRINSSSVFDDAGVRAFLDGYAATDLRSLQRVDKSRVLSGIPRASLVAAADSVQVRDGCGEALALADAVYVISANWSEQFVHATMLHTASKSSVAPTPQVIANGEKSAMSDPFVDGDLTDACFCCVI
ncbi:hypothetical protein BBJ28_00006591 [Nothophytophthora sp. Chile5]|nr:hypothetical protein BBJ28_00006591 [Nothophytophthora sp. Chile5]